MSIRTYYITKLTLLFLLVAGCEAVFTQAGIAQTFRDDAINSRANPYVRQQDRLAAEERDRMAWEAEQRRMEAEREAAIRNRHKVERKTDEGYQSPTLLNKVLEGLQPGEAIDLHGDLFTAFDGMILSATYYRGANGKDSVPIVLLHGLGGSRRDFDPIIPALIEAGMAVLVPDLRGHGNSFEFIVEEFGKPHFPYFPEIQEIPESPFPSNRLPNRWTQYQRMSADIEAGRFRKPPTQISMKRYDKYDERDFALMVYDLQVWQNFLVNENNQERLNIKRLNLVGTEMGAGLAVYWCRCDQAASKQTKTMTLISPVVPANAMEAKKGNGTFLAYLNNTAMKNSLQTMIIVGKDNQRALEDAGKVRATLLGKDIDNESGLKAKYPLIQCNTEKQGRDLFALTSARIGEGIPLFIKDRLAKLEAAAAEKRNDTSLVWSRSGTWNVKPAEKPAATTNTTSRTATTSTTNRTATSSGTTPTATSNTSTPTGTTDAANRQN